jgi:hypothetical protein
VHEKDLIDRWRVLLYSFSLRWHLSIPMLASDKIPPEFVFDLKWAQSFELAQR